MKKLRKIKLTFEKEVISNLNSDSLNSLKGGTGGTTTLVIDPPPPPYSQTICEACVIKTKNCWIATREDCETNECHWVDNTYQSDCITERCLVAPTQQC